MKKDVVGLALTWDGARWPANRLSTKARAFLGRTPPLSTAKLTAALRDGAIGELRICWVPRLKGGSPVLCDPFSTGRRISFRLKKTVSFGDVLGAVYKRV